MPICPIFRRNQSKYHGKQRENIQKERNHELYEIARLTPHAPHDLCANLTQVNRDEQSGLVCAS